MKRRQLVHFLRHLKVSRMMLQVQSNFPPSPYLFRVLLCAFCALLPIGDGGKVLGQGFLKDLLTKSPGPLAKPHAEYDDIKNCITCHQNRLGGDVANNKCLDCHEEFRDRLNKRGFHKDKPDCKTCHTEHKGLEHTIFAPKDWLKAFDHDTTDYSLIGKHSSVTCQDCHTSYRKHFKTKVPTASETYLDAPTDCYTCHKKVYEHRFTRKELLTCTECHSSTLESWKKLAKKISFDHSKTDFPLEGLHQPVKCANCHKPDAKKKRVTTFAPLAFSKCTNCHADPHKGKFGPDCVSCHTVYREWKNAIPAKVSAKPTNPEATTAATAKPIAEKGFDHSKTDYPLTGYHQAVACEGCHADNSKQFKISKDKYDECSDCHGFPHGIQFEKQTCENCHSLEKKFLNSSFDIERHNKTKFQLTGKHQVLDCAKCHYSGVFENIPSKECNDCHRNPHDKRQIEKECSFCHVTTTFSWIQFNHNKNTKFELTGKHRSVACTSCHVDEVFKDMPATNEKPNCQACHENPHGSGMPKECETCHRTEGFKVVQKFDHLKIARFELVGRHTELSCQKCHARHLLGDYKVPVTEPGLTATACANCHVDLHKGTYGKNCQSCHSNTSFTVEYGAKVHDLGYFKLEGFHDRLGCSDCHRPDTTNQGLGIVCANCHEKIDIHLGKLGLTCGDCHGQTAWLPTKFKHNQTGFRLTGAHRYAQCSDCHKNQIYEGLPSDCYFCHSDSYIDTTGRASPTAHSPGTIQDCADCHSQISWKIRRGSGLR